LSIVATDAHALVVHIAEKQGGGHRTVFRRGSLCDSNYLLLVLPVTLFYLLLQHVPDFGLGRRDGATVALLQGSESAWSIGQLQKVNSLSAATIRTPCAKHAAYRSVVSVTGDRLSYPPSLQFLWAVFRLRIPATILLCCLCVAPRAQAGATLFLGEPYGYDGAFAGTGHAAVYLSGVCAISPVVLRRCAPGEAGIVLSRYRGVGGYDWIAIPLIPYLYSVEKLEDIPLFTHKKLIAFLRDRYRRDHLASLVPDRPDGGTPNGDWYELVGASYLRTIYAFEIETRPEQDEKLIVMLNARSNRQRWNLVTANCADFVRQILSFYYPHSVHRSIIGDLGVTTPKQLARSLSRYSRRHPELRPSRFAIPQVPGTIPRSKRVKGVFEVMLTAKKYMLPIFLFHPYAAGAAVAVYVQHWHFNPGKNTLILDAKNQLGPALTSAERRAVQDRLEKLVMAAPPPDADAEEHQWTSLDATAEPVLDSSGGPVLKMRMGNEVTSVGIARANIWSVPDSSDFAAGLMKARLIEELKSAATQKTARNDVESDLELLKQLLQSQPRRLAIAASLPAVSSEVAH
jgi:hypothetical protein